MARMMSSSSSLQLHRTIDSLRSVLRSASLDRLSVGFVPTMGALHAGHAKLFQQARAQNDIVVTSIFVNPTQFAPGEDLDKYPRQLELDQQLLSALGVDHLFAPDAKSMYRPNHSMYVDPEDFDETAEGRARPGHFRGVATIVTKLFQIVRPDRAYFGQKDVTQCVLMRRLVQDLNMDIEICIVDTVREADGLAMSSRNAYLDARDRRAAPIVYKSLQAAQALYNKTAAATADDGTRARIDPARLRETVVSMLRSEWMVTEIQYVAVDDPETMRPIIIMLDELELFRTGAIISVACFIGNVRLIDNILLLPSP